MGRGSRRASVNPGAAAARQESKRKRIILSLFIVIVSFLVGWFASFSLMSRADEEGMVSRYPLYTLNTIVYFCPDCPVPLWLFQVPF